jgi:hypothetical protein
MPYLILSDIHANREALEAVIRHAQGHYDQILAWATWSDTAPTRTSPSIGRGRMWRQSSGATMIEL